MFGFFSMVDVRKRLHRELIARFRLEHPTAMLGAAIPTSEEVELMGEERTSVAEIAPGSPAAMAYETLWLDLRRRLDGPAPATNTLREPQ